MNSHRARLQRIYPDCWPWLSLARRIPGELTEDEASSLFRLARARTSPINPVIVELGAQRGKTSLMLAAGLHEKTGPRLFAFERDENAVRRNGGALERALRFWGLERIVRGTPQAAANWSDPIDILFVHGTEDSGLLQRELSEWSPFVKARGIVILRGVRDHLDSPSYEDLRVVDNLAWATKQCAVEPPRTPLDRAIETMLHLNTLFACTPPEGSVEFAAARLQDYVRRAAREIAEDRHAIQALKNSWSWKLTAPLRRIIEIAQAAAVLIDMPSGISRWLRFKNELRASGLFDERYYRDRYLRTQRAQTNPLLHYLVRGAEQGANPNELFDSAYYTSRYPDAAASGLPPAIHYLREGAAQGLDPHPYFDSSFYLEQNPDVRESGLNPLAHYLAPGIVEGRDPNPWFDTSEYLEQNPDVATFGLNPLAHQTESWMKGGRCSR